MVIEIQTLITISIICLFGMMSPGPNFIAVSYKSVNESRKIALFFTLGVSIVSMLWAGSILFGMTLLFSLFPWLFIAAKMIGGIYLIYLGYKIIKKPNDINERKKIRKKGEVLSNIKDGMITNLANPKSMVFYASVFSTSVPRNISNASLCLIILLVGVISLSWYSFVVLVLSNKKIHKNYIRYQKHIETMCGSFLIFFGVKQVVT